MSTPSKSVAFSVRDFFKRFPDDEACLNHIWQVRFGDRHECRKCKKESTFHRLADRRAWSCANCGDHVYPTAGTVFMDTRTPLQLWFYAIYLFVTTRHGVSGKELQRALGVTYKTAWRMGQHIRMLIEKADPNDLLTGHIEIDEAYVGGVRSGGKRGRGAPGKTIVLGMVERGGRIQTKVIPDVRKTTLRNAVLENVEPGSTVSTDELMSYGLLTDDGYLHGVVKHGQKEYSYYDYRSDTTFSTNTVEGFWKLFKVSVRSTHIHISPKYMTRYLNEFSFRSNYRVRENAMFDLLIAAV